MKKMQGIKKLFETINLISVNGWIYTNLISWEQQPDNAVFYFITEDEMDEFEDADDTVENSTGETIPRLLKKEDVETWLDVQTLQAILRIAQKSVMSPDSSILIKAVNHYREYDDFMDV